MKIELNTRLQLKPNEKGFKIEDSWFSDHSSNLNFVEDDRGYNFPDPNKGIEIPD